MIENNRLEKYLEHYSAHNPYADASMTSCKNQYTIYICQGFKCASINDIVLKFIAVFIIKLGPWRLYIARIGVHVPQVSVTSI